MTRLLNPTARRVKAMKEKMLKAIKESPSKSCSYSELYFKFRKENNRYVLHRALELVLISNLVKRSYVTIGTGKKGDPKRLLQGDPVFNWK